MLSWEVKSILLFVPFLLLRGIFQDFKKFMLVFKFHDKHL